MQKNIFLRISHVIFLVFTVSLLINCSKANFNSSEDPSSLAPDTNQEENGNNNNPNSPPPVTDFKKGEVFDPARQRPGYASASRLAVT